MVVAQSEIWWADLAEPVGSAPGYRRPVLILQGDALNRSQIGTVVCAVLTSNLHWAAAPGNVLVSAKQSGLDRDSVVNVSQIITIDKRQLTERVGKLQKRHMDAIFSGLDLVMGR
jgi:mRNA interferase MazF